MHRTLAGNPRDPRSPLFASPGQFALRTQLNSKRPCAEELPINPRYEERDLGTGTPLPRGARILFVRVLIFVQLLPGPLFASRNDWSGPSGMDFLFSRRWRLVEMGYNYMAYSLRPHICRLGHV